MNDPVCQLLYQRFAWPHVRIAFRSYRDTAPQDIADELAREANSVFGHYNLEIYGSQAPGLGRAKEPSRKAPADHV
jgi:hypothetical protein